MAIHYQLVFGLLIFEAFCFTLLITPIPKSWRKASLVYVSQSHLVANIIYGLKIALVGVFILFVDAINRMNQLTEDAHQAASNVGGDARLAAQTQASRFYAQRNVYLTGFTLFLSLILTRTYALILDLMDEGEGRTRAKVTTTVVDEASHKDADTKIDAKTKKIQ